MTARRALTQEAIRTGGTPRRALPDPLGGARLSRRGTVTAISAVAVVALAGGGALLLPSPGGYAVAVPAVATLQPLAAVASPTSAAPDAPPRTPTRTAHAATTAPASAAPRATSSSGRPAASPTRTAAGPTATASSRSTGAAATTATPARTTSASPAVSGAAAQVVAYAKAHLGFPYRIGAMGPDYYDCAGLVAAAYAAAGFDMTYSESYEASHGTYVAQADLRPGDVVVWGSPVHSVSIYVGNDTIIIADGPNYGIRAVSLSARTSWDTFAGGRRYLG